MIAWSMAFIFVSANFSSEFRLYLYSWETFEIGVVLASKDDT